MRKAGLTDPKFENERGTFKVTLYNRKKDSTLDEAFIEKIKRYCSTPKTKEEIAKFLGFDDKHPAYCIKTYIIPLIREGILSYMIPDKPKSKNQRIYTTKI